MKLVKISGSSGFLFPFFCMLVFSVGASAGANENCPAHLRGLSREVWLASLADAASDRISAQISPIRGNESLVLQNQKLNAPHIISFGSGPDVFRPLVAFPEAKTIHLVDHLLKWGQSRDYAFIELVMRLHALAENVEVKKIGKSPEHWRVRWKSHSVGEVEKEFFLHELDYQNPNQIARVFRSIFPERVGGILLAGAPPLSEDSSRVLEKHLAPGAWFILEAVSYSHKLPADIQMFAEYPEDLLQFVGNFLNLEAHSEALAKDLISRGYQRFELPPEPSPEDERIDRSTLTTELYQSPL